MSGRVVAGLPPTPAGTDLLALAFTAGLVLFAFGIVMLAAWRNEGNERLAVIVPVIFIVAVIVALPALFFLAAWPVRRRYTSAARWHKQITPAELAAMRAEVSGRTLMNVVIVGDKRPEAAEAPGGWPRAGKLAVNGRPQVHAVLPLDAGEGAWYCRTCERSFTSERGTPWCPDDPANPRKLP